MSDKVIPWRRFAWDLSKERASARLVDGAGYRSAWTIGHERASGLVPVEELEQPRCVVLLGESGLGKTHVLMELCKQQNERAPSSGRLVDLSSVHGPADVKALLEGTGYPWHGSEPPTLYLDAFELSRCPALGSVLGTMLAENGPRLRLAVRPGAWGQEHRNALQRVYGNDLREYELSVLSQQDVRLAAKCYGVDPEKQLPELGAAGAGPLLARPLTCRMILELAAARDLPQPLTRETLYRAGLERLLKGAIGDGKLRSPSVARLIAERLALATVFGGQEVFRCEQWASVLDQLITQEQEPLGGGLFHPQVTAAELRAVLLHSGVFTVTAGFAHWAHASFAEYLAAEYLRRHAVTGARLRSLLGMAKDGEVPTALEGVLGWLAPSVPDLWDEVVKKHPVQCLHADPMALSHEQREQLVEAIFDGVANHTIGSLTLPPDRLSALAHPGLAEQVRTRLSTENKARVMSEALHVAQVCGLKEVVDHAARLALSQAAPHQVRVSAGYAVCELGTPEQKRRLAPLLEGDPQDENHQLFGLALQALWPEQMTPEELFARLKAPVPGFAGAYTMFLYKLRTQLAEPEVLPVAIEWAREQPPSRGYAWPSELVDPVVEGILRSEARPWYLPALADIILVRARAHFPLVNSEGFQDFPWSDAIRREVVLELVRRGSAVDDVLMGVWHSDPPLVDAQADRAWLLQALSELQVLPEGWFVLLSTNRYSVQRCVGFDTFCELAERWPQLRAAWGSALEMPTRGADADQERKNYRSRTTRAQELHEECQRGQTLLVDFVAGDLSEASWVAAHYLNPPYVQGSPTRKEIEAAAVSALMQGRLTCEVSSSEAVRWALRLAWHQRKLNAVPTARWRELTDLSELDLHHEGPEFLRSVGEQLWLHARRELVANIRSMAAEWVGFGLQCCAALYPESWHSDLVAAWLGRMDAMVPEGSVRILEAVAMHGTRGDWLDGARCLATAADVPVRRTVRVLLYLFGEPEDREYAASGLFSAKRRVSMEIIEELSETWERLSKRCPISLEPDELASLALRVTGDSNAERSLREQALECLFAANGPGVEAALDRVRQGFPTSGWLQHRVFVAKRRLATSYWAPMELAQLFAFVRRRDLRIVRTQQELFDLAGEGLNAFQEELWEHADRLWNTDGKPKPEETLSKELEVFFRGYLSSQRVISVREPELRRVAHGMGPRVDVYVAVYPEQGRVDASQRLEVLLEVKRCVHQRWDQPESELKERYLSPGRRHGWYVVGRYDDGCAACKRMGPKEMQAHLDGKVKSLVSSVMVRAKVIDCSWRRQPTRRAGSRIRPREMARRRWEPRRSPRA